MNDIIDGGVLPPAALFLVVLATSSVIMIFG